MNLRRIALGALAVFAFFAPSLTAQSPCIQINDLGSTIPTDCGTQTAMITLTGSMDLTTRNLGQSARVSCWVCETGDCDAGSPYGPAVAVFDRVNDPVLEDWQFVFSFSSGIMAGTSPGPSLQGYYCRIEMSAEARAEPPQPSMPFTMPSYTATYAQARAEQGTQLVAELQGAFAQPVEPRRQR